MRCRKCQPVPEEVRRAADLLERRWTFSILYAAYEGAAKGTAITEAGWRTGDDNEPQVPPDVQALNLDIAFETARRVGYVRALCWFQLQDNPGYRHNTSWGLVDRTGQPKPAYLHFQTQ